MIRSSSSAVLTTQLESPLTYTPMSGLSLTWRRQTDITLLPWDNNYQAATRQPLHGVRRILQVLHFGPLLEDLWPLHCKSQGMMPSLGTLKKQTTN